MDLFTVRLRNQPGQLAHLCDVLAAASVNIELAGATEGERGTVVLIARDEASAATALEASGIEFTRHPAVLVRCPDQPGEAAKFIRKLAAASVNIEALLEISIADDQVVLACAVDKIDDARTALGAQVVG
jgi:hypothetical protein